MPSPTLQRLAALAFPALVLALLSVRAHADPWIAPGDVRLRHDIELLADAGLLKSPITSWPLSWPTVARDVLAMDLDRLDPGIVAAAERLREQARRAMRLGQPTFELRAAASGRPSELRGFDATPREPGELEVAASFTGHRIAWKLSGELAVDPRDGKELRPDGSYLGVTLGNWMISAGYMEKWWGPGWSGSLVLGNAARPVLSVTIERNYADPFRVPLLRWIGPWRLSFQMGQLEADRLDIARPRLFALRVNAKPHPSLEVGLARSAQYCGRGRPCGWNDFLDMFLGNSNTEDLTRDPGNQLAGLDARWKLPFGWPVAVYGQAMGEDEAGFLPSKYLGLAGVETWGSIGPGTWRANVEAADTACEFYSSESQFGCGYSHSVYVGGYNYRGRSIGHSMGGDGRMVSVGGLYVDHRGDTLQVRLRSVELNRKGLVVNHPLSAAAARIVDVDASYFRAFKFGTVRVSVGHAEVRRGAYDGGLRASLEWRTSL